MFDYIYRYLFHEKSSDSSKAFWSSSKLLLSVLEMHGFVCVYVCLHTDATACLHACMRTHVCTYSV